MNNKPVLKNNFIAEIRGEMRNVTWPTRRQALRLTAIVLLICLIVGLYIGIIDVIFAKGLEILTKIKK